MHIDIQKINEHLGDIAAHAQVNGHNGTVIVRHPDYDWFARVGITGPPMDEPDKSGWVCAVESPALAGRLAENAKAKKPETKKPSHPNQANRLLFDPAALIRDHGDWLRKNATVGPSGYVMVTAGDPAEFYKRGIKNKPQRNCRKWYVQMTTKSIVDFVRAGKTEEQGPLPQPQPQPQPEPEPKPEPEAQPKPKQEPVAAPRPEPTRKPPRASLLDDRVFDQVDAILRSDSRNLEWAAWAISRELEARRAQCLA